jgi:hypothetical protein
MVVHDPAHQIRVLTVPEEVGAQVVLRVVVVFCAKPVKGLVLSSDIAQASDLSRIFTFHGAA